MQNSELIDKLVLIAGGKLDLVKEAIKASAEPGLNGAADLKKVVDYIVSHRPAPQQIHNDAAA